jgi:methionine-R-sulfoxide reductase
MQMKPKENWNALTKEEALVIEKKGTEMPFSGEYYLNAAVGTYHCKRCDLLLYESDSKFDSGCGWPSFDAHKDKNVLFVLDSDGKRTEIICAGCEGHLGHVFFGEQFTANNTRHCVNSISVKFRK